MDALCLSFDVDWAADFVLADVLARLTDWGVTRGTLFVTHATAQNAAWRAAGFELGVHPNFNPLFDGEPTTTADEILAAMKSLVPDARSVRSHALTRSGRLARHFLAAGFTHESNLLLPWRAGNRLHAYAQPAGLLQVPFGWGDHDYLASGATLAPADCLDLPGLKVFNFHPIHVYLNCETIERYERARDVLQDRAALERHRHTGGGGIADLLQALVARARREGRHQFAIADLGVHHE